MEKYFALSLLLNSIFINNSYAFNPAYSKPTPIIPQDEAVFWENRGYNSIMNRITEQERTRLISIIRDSGLLTDDRKNASNLIIELYQVPEHERAGLITLIRNSGLLSDDRTNSSYVIEELRKVPEDERAELITLIRDSGLLRDDKWTAQDLIMAFHQVRKQEREQIINLIKSSSLLTNDKGNAPYIIDALREVPEQERAELISFIRESGLLRDDKWNAPHMIDALRRVPEHEIARLCGFIRTSGLLRVDKSNSHHLINEFRNVPASEREPIEHILQSSGLLVGERSNVYDLIKSLLQVPETHRYITVARAFMFMRGMNMQNNENRFREILETSLNNRIPNQYANMEAMALGNNPYAVGINVHHSDRDQRTTAAYQLLWQDETHLSNQKIEQAYYEFITFLKSQPESIYITKAQQTLGFIPCNGFGPLRGTVMSNGLNTKVQELLARLWIFANKGNEADRENKKKGLILGLADCVDNNHHLVCNPGKLQRLATAVLQGYLPGVVIDQGFVPETTSSSATTLTLQQEQHPQGEAARDNQPRLVTNLLEINEWLKPFYDEMIRIPPEQRSINNLVKEALRYAYNLERGLVPGQDDERVRLDLRELMYLLRMGHDGQGSGLMEYFKAADELEGGFRIDDYQQQFGERDRIWQVQAQAEQERRALREQQDREYAEAEKQDKQRMAAQTIQRFVKSSQERKKLLKIEKEKQMIKSGFAGSLKLSPGTLNILSPKEQENYIRQKRLHNLESTKKSAG